SASKSSESAVALVEQAQEKNLKLLASRIDQDIAKDDITLASSGHLPSLTLDGSYAFAGQTNTATTATGNGDYDQDNLNVGLNLKVPLY
ncbi:TolC family protein, partial [Vibrio sp. 10N.261.45.F1]